jgi:hypothetical protein
MKRVSFIIIFLYFLSPLKAQRSADLGFFAGTAYYIGELNTSKHFVPVNPALGLIYRYNFNPRYAIRWNLIYCQVSANNPKLDYLYWLNGGTSFRSTVMDMALQFEFNFLPFKSSAHEFLYSTYVSGGLGLSIADKPSGYSNDFVIPFGVGGKFNLSKKIALTASWEFRKTFYDDLDGVINLSDPGIKSFLHNTDWYNFGGISVVYKLFNADKDCPAYWDYDR